MKGPIFLIVFIFVFIFTVSSPVFALATNSIDEVINMDATLADTKLLVFEYEKGGVIGASTGFKGQDTITYYTPSTAWLTGDPDGDGRDGFIHVEVTPSRTDLRIYDYEKGVKEGSSIGLKSIDTLTYYTPTSSWVTGDIDGDGRDEFIRIDTTPYETNLRVLGYEKGFIDGGSTGLKSMDVLTYHTPATDWIAGDIDGDGRDELILMDTASSGTNLKVYEYETGFTEGANVGLRLQDTLKYYTPTTSWITGDVDGDGLDEMIHLDTTPYQTLLRIYGYRKGFTQGSNTGLENEDTLVYYIPTADWLTGDIDREFRISDYSPKGSTVLLDEGDPLSFSLTAYHSDDIAMVYQWAMDGQIVSSGTAWTFSTDYESAGNYHIMGTVTDGKGTLTRDWQIEVANTNRPPVLELTSPVDGASVKGAIDILWTVEDPDEDTVPVAMEYKEGIRPWVQSGVYPTTGSGSYQWDTTGVANGDYRLSLTATDSEGDTDEVTISVIVANPIQQPTATPPPTIVETPPPAETENPLPETQGVRVAFRSLPQGVTVKVDGEEAGVTNSAADLERGTYRLDFEKDGYYPRSKVVSVRDAAVEVTVIMVPSSAPYYIGGAMALFILIRLALFLRDDKIEKNEGDKPPEEKDDFSDVGMSEMESS